MEGFGANTEGKIIKTIKWKWNKIHRFTKANTSQTISIKTSDFGYSLVIALQRVHWMPLALASLPSPCLPPKINQSINQSIRSLWYKDDTFMFISHSNKSPPPLHFTYCHSASPALFFLVWLCRISSGFKTGFSLVAEVALIGKCQIIDLFSSF